MVGNERSTFGRSDDLAQAQALLTSPQARLLTLTGRAGVGKTHAAFDLVDGLGIETVVVELAGVRDPALVGSEVAARLGIPSLPGEDAIEAIAGRIGNDDVLLLLDNFEHLLDAAAIVGDLIHRCPSLRVVVTSQSPLRLRIEHVLALEPLPLPVGDDAEALRSEPAVALYCERARAVERSFALTDQNAAAIGELCRLLEGLPLSIELAAARAATLPASEAVARLADAPLDLLRRPRGDAPARHHDLRSAIAWAFDLLSPTEQQLLQQLSVVAGPFDVDAAEALSDELSVWATIDALSTLVDFHLVDPVPGTDPVRYTIPSSIRAYADERLRASGRHDAATERHISWRAAQARDAAAQVDAGAEATALAFVDAAGDDFTNTLQAALDADLVDEALELCCGLAPYWQYRGYRDAHEQLLDRALALAEKHSVRSAPHADALTWSAGLGLRLRITPDRERMVGRLRAGEELARSVGSEVAVLRALSFRMLAVPATGDLDGGTVAGEEGLERAREAGMEPWLARFEVWAGALARTRGDDEAAVALVRDGLTRARTTGDGRTVVAAGMILAPLTDRFPELRSVLPPLTESLTLARQLGLALYEAGILAALAIEAAHQRDLDEANRWCIDALTFVRGAATSPVVGFSLTAAIDVAALRGDYELAAYLHGVVKGARSVLQSNSAREQAAAHTDMLEETRRALGTERFDAATRRGEGVVWSDAVAEALARLRAGTPPSTTTSIDANERVTPLTPRQMEVLRLLADGLRNREIATRLDIAPKTVMHHLTAVYQTLGVRGRSEATAWAHRAGIVD